jgi:Raf kinase inhibitor-like YbhB/YbcL family protein
MLQKLPGAVGKVLHAVRPGLGAIAFERSAWADAAPSILVDSTSVDAAGRILPRCTADGAGVSPALRWTGVPALARSLVLLLEDADSPTPRPLVHLIAWSADARDGAIAEGSLLRPAAGWHLGRNSYLRNDYLPCDPPPGHGEHRYCFQLFALDRRIAASAAAGRRAMLAQMEHAVIARGLMLATYERAG